MRAYRGMLSPAMQPGMAQAEKGDDVSLTNAADEDSMAASRALHFALTMMCRGEPLSVVQNAGPGEGFVAWHRLCNRDGSGSETRLAGMLVELMRFNFAGDLQARWSILRSC